MPAFWTTAVSVGVFPQWMPFQSMGYPFLLNAQTALYYPLLWIFPILSIPFTLQADVIFQVLHVFLGSVGMFFFLKMMLKSPRLEKSIIMDSIKQFVHSIKMGNP